MGAEPTQVISTCILATDIRGFLIINGSGMHVPVCPETPCAQSTPNLVYKADLVDLVMVLAWALQNGECKSDLCSDFGEGWRGCGMAVLPLRCARGFKEVGGKRGRHRAPRGGDAGTCLGECWSLLRISPGHVPPQPLTTQGGAALATGLFCPLQHGEVCLELGYPRKQSKGNPMYNFIKEKIMSDLIKRWD